MDEPSVEEQIEALCRQYVILTENRKNVGVQLHQLADNRRFVIEVNGDEFSVDTYAGGTTVYVEKLERLVPSNGTVSTP